MSYPPIPAQRRHGNEPLIDTQGITVSQLSDFWSWAYSNLVGNTERGALAEYIVACALGIQDTVRVNWDRYDLLSSEGIAIEVKSSGYIQTWAQEKPSSLIFSIQPTYGWDSQTNQYNTEKVRQSDIYVFCVHKHLDQESVNPLDLSQWDFYLLPTQVLNKAVGMQKTISLSSLLKIGAEKCVFENLHTRIIQLSGT